MSDGPISHVFRKSPLVAGLYFVATPIGSARDITLRALDILASADVIAAEDTRMTRKLMELHGVPLDGRAVIPYHDHNGAGQRPRILEMIRAGKSVAYASDAGTPLVADPGFALGRAVIEAGLAVTSAPGPSAVLAALTLSGLPTDRFLFAGFVPNAKGARNRFLADLAETPATLVLFESPKRLTACLGAIAETMGADRPVVVCREITKKFEQAVRGSAADLIDHFTATPAKGEIVLVIDRACEKAASAEDIDAALLSVMDSISIKEAARKVSGELGLARRDVYQRALELKDKP